MIYVPFQSIKPAFTGQSVTAEYSRNEIAEVFGRIKI